jgi:hypothetical protein
MSCDFWVVESFVFCSSLAGGEQHLQVGASVGHVVVVLLNDPDEGEELASCVSKEEESVNRSFAGTSLENNNDIFAASLIFHSESGGGPSAHSFVAIRVLKPSSIVIGIMI